MKNKNLQFDLSKISHYDFIEIEFWSNEDGYYMQINGNGYLYHNLLDIIQDSKGLDKIFNNIKYL
jgi:hypothetical protein